MSIPTIPASSKIKTVFSGIAIFLLACESKKLSIVLAEEPHNELSKFLAAVPVGANPTILKPSFLYALTATSAIVDFPAPATPSITDNCLLVIANIAAFCLSDK